MVFISFDSGLFRLALKTNLGNLTYTAKHKMWGKYWKYT